MFQNQKPQDWTTGKTVTLTSYQSLFAEKSQLEKDNKILANAIIVQKDQQNNLTTLKVRNQ